MSSDVGELVVALDGRPLGRRGARTRRRLLDAASEQLRRRGVRELRVVDIARAAGTSSAAFYQYFRDVDDAVLVLAEEAGEELVPIAALVREWQADESLRTAREVVERFFALWDSHRDVLRARNLAAQEGVARFREVRNRSLSPLTDALATSVERSQAAGRVGGSVAPYAAAAAMVAMIERMAAFHADLEERGVTRGEVVETTARILHRTVTGHG